MARADQREGVLRGCPTCGTKVDDVKLALRDFRWVNESLPGKVGGMDLDFCITQAATGRGLFLEMKPPGGFVSKGARLTFRLLVTKGLDVWVVWGPEADGRVEVAHVDTAGRLVRRVTKPLEELAEDVASWWAAGLEEVA